MSYIVVHWWCDGVCHSDSDKIGERIFTPCLHVDGMMSLEHSKIQSNKMSRCSRLYTSHRLWGLALGPCSAPLSADTDSEVLGIELSRSRSRIKPRGVNGRVWVRRLALVRVSARWGTNTWHVHATKVAARTNLAVYHRELLNCCQSQNASTSNCVHVPRAGMGSRFRREDDASV